MRFQVDDHIQVARRPAVDAGFAFAGQADAIALVDAGRNLHRQRFVLLEASRAAARGARRLHDLAAAVTFRARLLNREKALLHAHLAMAVAGRALDRLGAGLGARAMAGLAFVQRRNADLGFGAARGFLQRDLEVVAQVGPAIHIGAAAAAAEDVAEDVAERIRETAHAGRARGGRRIDSRVAVLIVGRAFVRVRQYLVSLFGFLELRLGLRIIRIAVRMVFHRELAVGLFDLVIRRIAIDAEHFVKVFFGHDSV